jgi:hypothetical protein
MPLADPEAVKAQFLGEPGVVEYLAKSFSGRFLHPRDGIRARAR